MENNRDSSASINITSGGQAGSTYVVVFDQGNGGGGGVVRVEAAQLAQQAHEALVLQRLRLGSGHTQLVAGGRDAVDQSGHGGPLLASFNFPSCYLETSIQIQ